MDADKEFKDLLNNLEKIERSARDLYPEISNEELYVLVHRSLLQTSTISPTVKEEKR